MVSVVAARCGFAGGGGAARLGSMVVCALWVRWWCCVYEILAQPCAGLVPTSSEAGLARSLSYSMDHLVLIWHLYLYGVLLGDDQTANVQGSSPCLVRLRCELWSSLRVVLMRFVMAASGGGASSFGSSNDLFLGGVFRWFCWMYVCARVCVLFWLYLFFPYVRSFT